VVPSPLPGRGDVSFFYRFQSASDQQEFLAKGKQCALNYAATIAARLETERVQLEQRNAADAEARLRAVQEAQEQEELERQRVEASLASPPTPKSPAEMLEVTEGEQDTLHFECVGINAIFV
jgi:hypothetical protein